MKRITSVLLVFALVASLHAGCATTTSVMPPAGTWTPGAELEEVFVVLRDGTAYRLVEAEVSVGMLRGRAVGGRTLSIPLEQIYHAWQVRRGPSVAKLVLVPLAIAGAVVASLWIHVALTSCPFVYVQDGEHWVLAAEPLGGAVAPMLQRVDSVVLERLAPVGGLYRLKLANELDETQYVDSLALWVVDHPRGVRVVTGSGGELHTIGAPKPPRSVLVNGRRNGLTLLQARDGVSWSSDMNEKLTDSAPALRDEIVVTFDKPAGAERVKLLLQLSHSPWAVFMFKRYLALLPPEVWKQAPAGTATDGRLPPLREALRRQGLLHLELSLWDGAAWGRPRYVAGGSPLLLQERVVDLDLREVVGNEVKLRLRGAAGLWMLDAVAGDFAPDLPLTRTPLSLVRARADDGSGIAGLLREDDGRYYVLDRLGESAVVEFASPPGTSAERSVLLEIGGYYEIHEAVGRDPNAPPLVSFLLDPEAAGRYSVESYRERVTAERGRTRR